MRPKEFEEMKKEINIDLGRQAESQKELSKHFLNEFILILSNSFLSQIFS